MILVDSSVWIDYLRDLPTLQTEFLDRVIGTETLATADLVLTEVLQGTNSQRAFQSAQFQLTSCVVIDIAGGEVAIQAARNYRFLRAKGITVRKTIDTLIATRCIVDGHVLLYSDRDFDPFVAHLGLISAMGQPVRTGM